MDRRKQALEATKPSSGATRDLCDDKVIWQLPFKVRPKFCDVVGQETNDIFIESNNDGVEWAYMFMLGLHAKEELPQAARIRRNRVHHNIQQPGPAPVQPAPPRQRRRSNDADPAAVAAAGSFETAMCVDAIDDDDL